MRTFITGGTGLIGSHLARELLARGDQVVVLTRSKERASRQPILAGAQLVEGDPNEPGDWQREVDGCDAVVHFAGQNIFGKRWNQEIKQEIRESRLKSTAQVVEAIRRSSKRPDVFVSGSAIGYYGPCGDEELIETASPGDDFMAGSAWNGNRLRGRRPLNWAFGWRFCGLALCSTATREPSR